MSTEEPVSASMNAIMTASDSAVLCMSGSDSDFSNFIEDDLVESSISFTV